jgi:hypothetical protein
MGATNAHVKGSSMNTDITLGGWYLDERSKRQQLPIVCNPTEDDVLRALNLLREGAGVVVIQNKSAPEVGPRKIELYAEGGKYMPMLSGRDDDDEYFFRTLVNEAAPKELTAILGEPYPAATVIDNFDLVCQVLKEFANTGDVSEVLMQ